MTNGKYFRVRCVQKLIHTYTHQTRLVCGRVADYGETHMTNGKYTHIIYTHTHIHTLDVFPCEVRPKVANVQCVYVCMCVCVHVYSVGGLVGGVYGRARALTHVCAQHRHRYRRSKERSIWIHIKINTYTCQNQRIQMSNSTPSQIQVNAYTQTYRDQHVHMHITHAQIRGLLLGSRRSTCTASPLTGY